MRNLRLAIHRLSRPQRLALAVMSVLVGLTWLAVCLVVASYWAF